MGDLPACASPAFLQGALLDGLDAHVAGHLDDLTAHLVVASGRASDGGGLAATVAGLYVPVGAVEPAGFHNHDEGLSEGVRGLLCGVQVVDQFGERLCLAMQLPGGEVQKGHARLIHVGVDGDDVAGAVFFFRFHHSVYPFSIRIKATANMVTIPLNKMAPIYTDATKRMSSRAISVRTIILYRPIRLP